MSSGPSYWLISAPSALSKERNLKSVLSDPSLCTASLFRLPELRVGTLDALLTLSDDLGKYDQGVESVCSKILRQLEELLAGKESFTPEVAKPSGEKVSVTNYLQSFQWDEAQYPINKTLREMSDTIHEKVSHIDDELKTKLAEYNTVKGNLATLTRKETGSLSVRSLDDIVRPDDFIDSEYLTTLLVVVPKSMYGDWESSYQTLGDIQYIVPGSTRKLYEDIDSGLWTVVLFKKFADQYKNECRAHRFMVRDFSIDAERSGSAKDEKERLQSEEERRKIDLRRMCISYFSQVFSTWIHLKSIRLYVESILRYGLPPKFDAFLIRPNKKNERKLRDTLDKLLNELSSNGAFRMGQEEQQSMLGEFYPYVYLPLNAPVPGGSQ